MFSVKNKQKQVMILSSTKNERHAIPRKSTFRSLMHMINTNNNNKKQKSRTQFSLLEPFADCTREFTAEIFSMETHGNNAEVVFRCTVAGPFSSFCFLFPQGFHFINTSETMHTHTRTHTQCTSI